MEQMEFIRFARGYLLGGFFFLAVIPSIIYYISLLKLPFLPQKIFSTDALRYIISTVFIIPGVIFMLWSNLSLFFTGGGGPTEGFGVEISPKTKSLVTTGPYRYTRNPMVFGACCIYLALSVYINSLQSMILVLLFLPAIIIYLRRSEEKRLLKDFGEDFIKYREKVSLLIPLPRKSTDR